MKKTTLLVLVLMIAAQIAVPFYIINRKESILRNGTVFKFMTQPVDPSDALRGKYITLQFKATTFEPAGKPVKFEDEENVFAEITTDSAGYARIGNITKEAPAHTRNFIAVKIAGSNSFFTDSNSNEETIRIDYPFDRFYLDEYKAPRAEKMYNEANREENAYALVTVYGGKAVITDVMIGNVSVKDLGR
jgi:uncharacterized membrane-anchored protein